MWAELKELQAVLDIPDLLWIGGKESTGPNSRKIAFRTCIQTWDVNRVLRVISEILICYVEGQPACLPATSNRMSGEFTWQWTLPVSRWHYALCDQGRLNFTWSHYFIVFRNCSLMKSCLICYGYKQRHECMYSFLINLCNYVL